MKSFAVLILAAGYSSRMGKFKPLLEINGETIIDHLISKFTKKNIGIYIVIGYRGQDIITSVKNSKVIFIENPE